MIDKATEFAAKAHEGQLRKGTKRPYIVHPVEVGDIVASMTNDQEIIAAAILHDTLEDCPQVTEEILRREFGSRVTELVLHESEDKTKSWKERKQKTVNSLSGLPREAQYIALADKLSNMRDIDRDYALCGEELWNRFRMKDKHIIGWYYIEIMHALEHLQGIPAYEEYCRLVKKIFKENF